jgi:hypothetical protein
VVVTGDDIVEVKDDDHVTFMVADDWVYTASSMP